jgi:hypothetical protein
MKAAWVALAVFAYFSFAAISLAGPVDDAVKSLQSLGKEGVDNQAATRAWSVAAQAGPNELTTLLGGLDEANPLGANYLRAAVDVVVDRTLKAKSPTPLTAVETFLKDTSHSPRARRLAFEVITRFDAAAPDRLVPTFIDDPSTELRRDAVQRLIDQAAKQAKDEATKPSAIETYRQAFSGSRDLDQIELLTKELKGLGVTVDLPTHFGFVMNWKLIGPFDNTAEIAFDVAYPPEKEIRLEAEYKGKGDKPIKWIDHATADAHGKVDFNKALGKANGVTGYAYSEFTSPKDMAVDFRVGCICAFKLWVNGELVDGRNVYHSGTKIDQYIGHGKLKAGKNTILVKVLQNEQTQNWAQDWDFQLRVCDATGTAILSQDRVAAK